MCSNQYTSNKTVYIACVVIFMGLFGVSLSFFILKESYSTDSEEFKTLVFKEIESLKQKLKLCRGNKSKEQRTNHLESDKPKLRFHSFKLSDFRKSGNYLLANNEGIYGIIMPIQGFR